MHCPTCATCRARGRTASPPQVRVGSSRPRRDLERASLSGVRFDAAATPLVCRAREMVGPVFWRSLTGAGPDARPAPQPAQPGRCRRNGAPTSGARSQQLWCASLCTGGHGETAGRGGTAVRLGGLREGVPEPPAALLRASRSRPRGTDVEAESCRPTPLCQWQGWPVERRPLGETPMPSARGGPAGGWLRAGRSRPVVRAKMRGQPKPAPRRGGCGRVGPEPTPDAAQACTGAAAVGAAATSCRCASVSPTTCSPPRPCVALRVSTTSGASRTTRA